MQHATRQPLGPLCDACGNPATEDALGFRVLVRQGVEHVCMGCVDSGYLSPTMEAEPNNEPEARPDDEYLDGYFAEDDTDHRDAFDIARDEALADGTIPAELYELDEPDGPTCMDFGYPSVEAFNNALEDKRNATRILSARADRDCLTIATLLTTQGWWSVDELQTVTALDDKRIHQMLNRLRRKGWKVQDRYTEGEGRKRYRLDWSKSA